VNDDFRTNRFQKGPIYSKDLEKLRDGVRADTMQRTFRGRTMRTAGGQVFMPYAMPQSKVSITGGQGYKITIVSGSETEYIVTVHAGFPFNDVAEATFTGTLTLLHAIENDLLADSVLFATCFLNPDFDEDEDAPEDRYKCYVAETLYNLV